MPWLVVVVLSVAASQAEPQNLPRVRTPSPGIADAIAQGIQRSPTFRRLVESIDGTDGLVYVEEGVCRYSARACLVMSVTIAGPHRVLHIRVNRRRAAGCRLVELVGHELQHAVEVLSNPTIRSDVEMVNFFDRIRQTGSVRFETAAALQTSIDVAREVCRR